MMKCDVNNHDFYLLMIKYFLDSIQSFNNSLYLVYILFRLCAVLALENKAEIHVVHSGNEALYDLVLLYYVFYLIKRITILKLLVTKNVESEHTSKLRNTYKLNKP